LDCVSRSGGFDGFSGCEIAGVGTANAAHTASEPLTLKTKLLYGAPSFAGAAMIIPIFIHMPKFYADVVLVPLGYLAMAIAIRAIARRA